LLPQLHLLACFELFAAYVAGATELARTAVTWIGCAGGEQSPRQGAGLDNVLVIRSGHHPRSVMNYDLFRTINDWSGHRLLDDVMKVFAKDLLFAVFAVFALLCGVRMRERDMQPVIYAFGGVVLTFVFGSIAAKVHPESRPFQTHEVHQLISHDPGQSFPSDHAMAAFGVALAVLMFLSRAWGGVLAVAAVAIGFARVYAGVHYPGDIAGAFAVAVIGVGVVASVAWLRPPAPVTSSPPAPSR